MKKIVLAAINAKYIHSNLALRYLSRFQDNDKNHTIITREFTINQRLDFILEELYRLQPDVILFSVYIWNVEQFRQLCPLLKKILPDCIIGAGGPEVSYESEAFLRENPSVDFLQRGEGERVFTKLLKHWDSGMPASLSEIGSLTFRQNGRILSTMQEEPLDLALLPFPYEADFSDIQNQILYYESSRGCPYQCGYCLSSVEQGVRFVPLEKVLPDLQRFLDARVPQVKFIDRTFNCRKSHAMAIWKYLHEHDNGVTNFHFEITADIIDQETIDFLKTVRKGLFQFEIGVQSTNPHTIHAINRNVDFEKLSHIVKQIAAGGNIHQHLDLIAGLPQEDYLSFGRSFDDVYHLEPEQLQLGFLKLLKGSMLHRKRAEFAIVSHDTAPYEVMTTHCLPYGDTLRLKYIEEMVETYYNSGKFRNTLAYLVPLYERPFAFYEALAQFWQEKGCQYQYLSKIGLCDVLWDFVQQNKKVDLIRFQWAMKFDIALHEKPRKLPHWLTVGGNGQEYERITAKLVQKYIPSYLEAEKKTLIRNTYLDVFGEEMPKAILLDYGHRDLLGNAEYLVIPMEQVKELQEEEKSRK
ncbi:MAG: B12-binding domain-containing radical SAM protein [Bacillota bacterium]|nr:B12-binding domain-containing radical SAM protein [Bacillota bacterium]